MQSTDLRVGNLLFRKVSSNEWDEFIVRPIDIYRLNENNNWLIDHKPIPIDATKLQEFGFVKRDDFDVYTNIWELNGFMVSLGDYINIHVDWADVGQGYHSIRCYEELFAHELQNIYFALIGSELKKLHLGDVVKNKAE